MLNESLQGNIIVVMPTGTGKTQIAVHRILAEIDRGNLDKLIWFLCPTVALCGQHMQTMTACFPPMWCRSFTSNDNVDHWGTKATWNVALSNVKIAISTYQVLYDVLVHGFVNMARLSLLIFDEAHHCTEDHAANKIMREYYHTQLQQPDQHQPRILGLTASPILSDLSTLQTPRQFYAQLLRFTNQPLIVLRQPSYTLPACPTVPLILEKLRDLTLSHHEESAGLKKAKKQLTRFVNQAQMITQVLGGWAATNYMKTSITQFKSAMRMNAEKTNAQNLEKEYAMKMLCKLGVVEEYSSVVYSEDVSPICRCLLDALMEERSEGFRGLIFVPQRATVLALKWLIENHPETSKLFLCGTFVGMSQIQHSRTKLGDVHDIRSQMETLRKFRDGSLNLIITTDVLEEGIDIPACNTVVNFNCALNLKSFIQRRGRARKKRSKFIIILEDENGVKKLRRLEMMESELVRKFQDERRKVPPYELNKDEHTRGLLSFHVSNTGAQLTMGNAVSHLYNFCSKLPAQPYVSNRPLFSCETNDRGQVQAIVRLPSNLDPSLHTFGSSRRWARKKWAREDAALQAYKALFQAKLVNEHLLPFRLSDILDKDPLPRSHYIVPEQLDPWLDVASLWRLDGQLFSHELWIMRPQKDDIKLFMILPFPMKTEICIPLFLGPCTTYTALLSPAETTTIDISICQQVTHLILQSIHRGHGPQGKVDYVNLLVPDRDPNTIAKFLERYSATRSLAVSLQQDQILPASLGLLRHVTKLCRPLLVESLERNEYPAPDGTEAGLSIKGKIHPVTRRRNFLHAQKTATGTPTEENELQIDAQQSLRTLAAQEYSVDRLPSVFAEAALLVPSIIHEIGIYLIAEKLRKHIFSGPAAAPFQRMDLLAIAVRPTTIEYQSDFRSLAFLGDAIIKFLIARQLFLHHIMWHEGLLTGVKSSIVSDAGLALAVCQSGFGEFLITRRFNGKRWRPAFVSTALPVSNSRANKRQIGAANLADMAKALVGAAFLDNGMDQAATCIAAMIPKIKSWNASSLYDGTYSKSRPPKVLPATALVDLEQLLGYTFADKSLAIEAMTHPSCTGVYGTGSYRRLSFLGVSVIEWVVVSYLHRQKRLISSKRLQSLKSAVTNNKFLIFVCLVFHEEREREIIEVDDEGNAHAIWMKYRMAIYNFLRSHSDTLSAKVSDVTQNSPRDVDAIKKDLWEKGVYPWARLSALENIKALSDIVQSIFGAIYIDSLASLQKCEVLAEKTGILPLLEHLISHDVVTDHPKDTLQILLPKRKISYRIYEAEKQPMTTKCGVMADGSEIATVEGQTNRGALIVHAAEEAYIPEHDNLVACMRQYPKGSVLLPRSHP
ncbi:hypothetical protein BDV29DRAFT_197577 [Aspergillus leporis]|uniref:Dicer-like protein 1 n=1 Tax=Aspergillus leporis TaxID=41062 RepID=A0A5N5WRL8_9EURO|nr:hypothetical protein BDV29DRAFT_197577 [Aspergillus leporis]